MSVYDTERLNLRRLGTDDEAFMLELVNDPDWLRYIGDRGVRDIADARRYISDNIMAMYSRYGFGLFMVELKQGGVPIGICGLVKRETLDDVDIGFAFLPAYRNNGYAREAARATMAYATEVLHLSRVVAITTPDNTRSIALLKELGFAFERPIQSMPAGDMLSLFALEL